MFAFQSCARQAHRKREAVCRAPLEGSMFVGMMVCVLRLCIHAMKQY